MKKMGTHLKKDISALVRKSVFLLLLALSPAIFGANPVSVSGNVTDKTDGQSMIGISIIVKGTTRGVISDVDGNFTLPLTPGQDSILTFTYIGYKPLERRWNGETVMRIVMEPQSVDLDELVVVGYGTQKKADVTGAMTSVSKQRIEDMVATDLVQIIQASVPGLNVMATAAGSDPSDGALMLIRGRNSITASNDPLIVLDGIPYNGSISDINPVDVESINVLKDASSAAIYGSRGANGVILIQTRKGEEGRVKVKYDGFYGIQNVGSFPSIMTGREYYEYKRKWTDTVDDDDDAGASLSNSELAVWESESWKNWKWEDLILRRGYSTRHNISISGGTRTSRYSISGGIVSTEGIVINDKYLRGNTRINVTTDVTKWLRLESSSMLTYTDKSGAKPNFTDVFNKSPLMKPYNEDGTVNIYPDSDNHNRISPLDCLLWDDQNNAYSASTNNSLNVDIPFVKGLSYRLNTGIQYNSSEQNWYRGQNTGKSGAFGGEAQVKNGMRFSYTIENIASYQRDFGKHNIFVTALYSQESAMSKANTQLASEFPNDLLSWYGISQAGKLESQFDYSQSAMQSQMLRLNYTYDSRYLITGTVRRDGYSGFGENNKWGTFPSIALAWNVSNEAFFERATDVVNSLKLRFSFGENGNQAIKPYQTISALANADYVSGGQLNAGYYPDKLGFSNLGWETTRALNMGIDFALLRSRINGEFNIYRNNTYDLLLERQISSVNGGADKIVQNIGKTRNEGIEFAVNTTNIDKRKFRWSTNLNFALISTKITDLYGDKTDDINNKWFIGQPIRVNYDYWITGVWQLDEADLAALYGAQPGYAKYVDENNSFTYDAADRQIIGSPEPNFTWSVINNFTYRQFTLSVFVYGAAGMTKANPFKQRNIFIQHNFWTPDNPTNDYWTKDDNNANQYIGGRTITPSVFEKADFVRVKDITLSYAVPAKVLRKISFDKLDVYVTAKNPFTFTQYTGMDPELDTQRAIPVQREFIMGLKVSF